MNVQSESCVCFFKNIFSSAAQSVGEISETVFSRVSSVADAALKCFKEMSDTASEGISSLMSSNASFSDLTSGQKLMALGTVTIAASLSFLIFERIFGGKKSSEIFDREIEKWSSQASFGENRAEAADRIKECRNENHIDLDLSNLGLTSLPKCLADLKIKTLNCSGNRLKQILALPKGLIVLDCSRNELKNLILPEGLRKLNCSYNKFVSMRSLPSSLLILNCSSCGSERFSQSLNEFIRGLSFKESPRIFAKRVEFSYKEPLGFSDFFSKRTYLDFVRYCL